MVMVLPRKSVNVRPKGRQHSESLPLCVLAFGVTQHPSVQFVRVAPLKVQPESDVAIRVNLNNISMVRCISTIYPYIIQH